MHTCLKSGEDDPKESNSDEFAGLYFWEDIVAQQHAEQEQVGDIKILYETFSSETDVDHSNKSSDNERMAQIDLTSSETSNGENSGECTATEEMKERGSSNNFIDKTTSHTLDTIMAQNDQDTAEKMSESTIEQGEQQFDLKGDKNEVEILSAGENKEMLTDYTANEQKFSQKKSTTHPDTHNLSKYESLQSAAVESPVREDSQARIESIMDETIDSEVSSWETQTDCDPQQNIGVTANYSGQSEPSSSSSDAELSSSEEMNENIAKQSEEKVEFNAPLTFTKSVTPKEYLASYSDLQKRVVIKVDSDSQTENESSSPSSDPESSSEEIFDVMDIFLTEEDSVPCSNDGFQLVRTVDVATKRVQTVAPDVLLILNKGHEFNVHQEILRANSRYFEERLSATGKSFYTLHLDSEFVNPEALDAILHFLYEKRFSSIHPMSELIKTAMFFEMNTVLNQLQEVLENKKIIIENALQKFVFTWDLYTDIQKSQYYESPILEDQVTIRGNYGDLTTDQLALLGDSEFLQNKRCSIVKASPDTQFDQVALKPKIIVDSDNPQSIWIIDALRNNFNDAVFIDSTEWKTSVEASQQKSVDFLALHFERLVVKNDYLKFNIGQMDKLLQQDVLAARSEMVVFLAALKWIDHAYLEREEFAEQLLSNVRFSDMTAEELLACYHPPILMGLMEMPRVQDMLHKALQFITAKSLKQEKLFQHLASKPRVLLLKGKSLTLWEMDAYDPDCYSSPSSESFDDFVLGRVHRNASTQTQDTRLMQIIQLRKKTHVSNFIMKFGDE